MSDAAASVVIGGMSLMAPIAVVLPAPTGPVKMILLSYFFTPFSSNSRRHYTVPAPRSRNRSSSQADHLAQQPRQQSATFLGRRGFLRGRYGRDHARPLGTDLENAQAVGGRQKIEYLPGRQIEHAHGQTQIDRTSH